MTDHSPTVLRSVFVTGLQNAHALENQALALIDRQLDRLVHYPEVADRLRAHRLETEQQIDRLDQILADLGEGHSSLKDAALNFMGNMAALGNIMAADEILKNSFINCAFEHFEIASYTSLITLAEAGQYPAAARLLDLSRQEERTMAAWAEDAIPRITAKYVELRSRGSAAAR